MVQPFASRWEWEVRPSELVAKWNNFARIFDLPELTLVLLASKLYELFP